MFLADAPVRLPYKMRMLRLPGAGRVEMTEVDDPDVGAKQALVRIEATAICGSERGPLERGMPTGNAGHEAAGIVVDAPPESGFAPGQRVGICAVRGCGTCRECQNGRQTRCLDGPSVQVGMHAQLVAAMPSMLRAVPDGTDPVIAVLMSGDTLGVPARGLRRVPAEPGAHVAVVGLGPVGLASVLVRSTAGATVVGIEPSPQRRALALAAGAVACVAPGDGLPFSPELVIEASGRPDGIRYALDIVAAGGTVLQAGECPSVEVSPSDVFVRREVTYTGSWYYADEDWPAMVDLVTGGLDLRSLVTHEMAAGSAADAFAAFVSATSGKVVLRWDS